MLIWTQWNKTRSNAIINVPVAPSIAGENNTIQKNIGVVRNAGTDVTLNVTPIERRAIRWNIGGNFSHNNSVVVRLNPGQTTIPLSNNLRIAAGYPLFARFERPIVGFADANGNGIIEPSEIVLGDSAVYVGQEVPKYQLNMNTGVALLNGRISMNATFAYQNGMTQFSGGTLTSGAFSQIANAPGTPLGTQAALVAATYYGQSGGSQIGLIQTVNTFRFSELSINYTMPNGFTQWLHIPRISVAVQGKNLALHTNYRGKDPDVNAFATVSDADITADTGQLPEARTWWLRFNLGN
jgi:hypothetical protein